MQSESCSSSRYQWPRHPLWQFPSAQEAGSVYPRAELARCLDPRSQSRLSLSWPPCYNAWPQPPEQSLPLLPLLLLLLLLLLLPGGEKASPRLKTPRFQPLPPRILGLILAPSLPRHCDACSPWLRCAPSMTYKTLKTYTRSGDLGKNGQRAKGCLYSAPRVEETATKDRTD